MPAEIDSKEREERFKPFEERMKKAGLAGLLIDTFRRQYCQFLGGGTGYISRAEIDPVDEVPNLETLADFSRAGRSALEKTVVIKLNGGLGTGMGMERAKSLLEVKNGLSFLDIIARQVSHFKSTAAGKVPLIVMNSFRTREDSLAALDQYPGLSGEIPLDFLQNMVPKIDQHSLGPVDWPDNPELEWCPPGHGDIYTALATSGMLDDLLARGYEYAFVSNADNLGAVLDLQILGYFTAHDVPFMLEVADRTGADRKGGHLARTRGGTLALREIAQCPPEEREEFQDGTVYRYFNTNTIWINLTALDSLLREWNYLLPLPLIINSKTVDPRDASSPPVYQLETAMGSAVSLFPGSRALRVPRTRFSPVKSCEDLLGLWSDAYTVTEDWRITVNPERTLGQLVIELDPRFYRRFDQLKARFGHGAPSLVDCEKLVVEGDVLFGRNVVLKGRVHLVNRGEEQYVISDGEVIQQ